MDNESLIFDPLLPDFHTNPYPYYATLRSEKPRFWSETHLAWIFTSYEDVKGVLRDQRFDRNPQNKENYQAYLKRVEDNPVLDMKSRWMLYKSPPYHTQLRGLLAPYFSQKFVQEYSGKIEEIAKGLLVDRKISTPFEIMSEFAYPLPVTVVCDILGIPKEDTPFFRKLAHNVSKTHDPVQLDAQTLALANDSAIQLQNYFEWLFKKKQKEPDNSLVSYLVANPLITTNSLSINDVISNCIFLVIAGHGTTMNMIGNGVLALLNNHTQLKKLIANPNLIEAGVEELLRYDCPVQMISRLASENIYWKDIEIKKGVEVLLVLGAANRDPDCYTNPEEFDVSRNHVSNLAFSQGIHYCLGASLARAELRIGYSTLLNLLSKSQVNEITLEWSDTLTLRGPKTLLLHLPQDIGN